MEIIVLSKSQDVYLLSSDSLVNKEDFNNDPKTTNCILVKTSNQLVFDGNFLVCNKYYPFEDLDRSKSKDYTDIIKQNFSDSDFIEKIVEKLFLLSNEQSG